MVNIRLLEQKDVYEIHPQGMRDTAIGWAIDIDDRLVAICGVSLHNGLVIAFSKIKDGVKIPPITVVRTGIKINAMIRKMPYPVIYALSTQGRLLTALGWEFVETRGPVELFRCKPHF